MKKIMILLAAIFVMMPLALFAQGKCGHGPGMGMGKGQCMEMGMGMKGGMCGGDACFRPGMIIKMADDLGLTDDQKNQIIKLNEQDGLARIDSKAELEKAQLKLHHLMMNDGAEKDILAAMDNAGKLRTDLRKAQFQHMRKVKAVLTADQIKKFKELCPKMCGDDGPKGCGMGPGMGMEMDPEMGMGPGMNMERMVEFTGDAPGGHAGCCDKH